MVQVETKVVDYATKLTQGFTQEQIIQLLCGLGILAIGVWAVKMLLKVGKLVIAGGLVAILLGFGGMNWFNVAVITEEAVYNMLPQQTAETVMEIDQLELRKGLLNAFVGEEGGPIEKFKNTRLALLLADVIERSVEEYDGDFTLSFGNYDVEVYSGTVRVVPKVT